MARRRDIEHTTALPDAIEGRDAAVKHYKEYPTAFPDFDLEIVELLADGDKVVQRSVQTGTHDGTLFGIDPTGEPVEFQAIVIHRIEDGKDVESWVQIDVMGVLQQLGVLEPPGE